MINFNYAKVITTFRNSKVNKISAFTKMNSYKKILADSFLSAKTAFFKSSPDSAHYKALIRTFLMKNGKSKTMQSNSYKALAPLNTHYAQLNFAITARTIFESYASPFNYEVKKSLYNKRRNLAVPKWYSSLKEQKLIFSFLKELIRVPSNKSLSKVLHRNIFMLASQKSKLAESQLERQQKSTDLWVRSSVSFKNQKLSEKNSDAWFLNNFPEFYAPKFFPKDYGTLKNNSLLPDEARHKRLILFNENVQKKVRANPEISFRTLRRHRLNIKLTNAAGLRGKSSLQRGAQFDSISWFNTKKISDAKENTFKKLKHNDTTSLVSADMFKQEVAWDSLESKGSVMEKDLLFKLKPKINQRLGDIGYFPLSKRAGFTMSFDSWSHKKGGKYSWALEKKLLNRLLSSVLRRGRVHPPSEQKGRYNLLSSRKNSLELSVKNLDSLTSFDSIQKYREYPNYPSSPFFINQRTHRFISLKHVQVLKRRVFNVSELSNTFSNRLLLFSFKDKLVTNSLTLRFDLVGWNPTSFHRFVPRLKKRLYGLNMQGCFKILEKPVRCKIKRATLLRSPHVNKKSQQHFDKVEYFKTLVIICEFKQTLSFEKLSAERIKTLISSIIRQTAGIKLKVSFV